MKLDAKVDLEKISRNETVSLQRLAQAEIIPRYIERDTFLLSFSHGLVRYVL